MDAWRNGIQYLTGLFAVLTPEHWKLNVISPSAYIVFSSKLNFDIFCQSIVNVK